MRPRLQRVRAALPAAGLGRARRGRDLGRHARASRAKALDDAGIDGPDLAGIGITNQRETVVAWDPDTGEPLHRALVWQDRRTAARCDELKEEGHEPLFRERTGLVLDPYFSGHEDRVAAQGGRRRPGRRLRDDRLVARAQADRPPRDRLLERLAHAAVRHPQARLGRGAVRAARRPPGLAARAAAERARVRRDDRVRRQRAGGRHRRRPAGRALRAGVPRRRASARTPTAPAASCSRTRARARPTRSEGLLTTVAWGVGDRVDYALEAAIFVTGAAVQWLRDGLGIIDAADETEALARSLDSNDGVYFVPALTGPRLAALGSRTRAGRSSG